MNKQDTPLLSVRDLTKHFPIRKGFLARTVGYVRAVNAVSFDVQKGETLALVGESGCGKSTTGRCIGRLTDPTSGDVLLDGHRLGGLSRQEMADFRRRIQFVFQDPFASLTPHMSAGALIQEPMRNFGIGTPKERRERAEWLVERVGVRASQLSNYPHEFSGGQRQRICVARALAVNPDLVILDEPVSALDVSIQAQAINLLMGLQNELHLTYLFISHDLAVVRQISQRIAVMYLGHIIEVAPTNALFQRPWHPYTRALISAVPKLDPTQRNAERILLEGDVPSPSEPIVGCPFRPRCQFATQVCADTRPPLEEVEPGRHVACHVRDIYPEKNDLNRRK